MSAQIKYIPEENERAYYQGLFKTADVQGRGQIGGTEAVQFFTRSKLPIDTLKNIWTVADQPPSNYLDLPKFAVAVRLIQCMQNGQRGQGANLATPPGVVMRPAMFEGVSGMSVPLPAEQGGGAPAPDPMRQSVAQTPAAAPDAMRQSMAPPQTQAAPAGRPPVDPRMSMMTQQHQQMSTALATQDPYLMTPQDVQRMEPIFKEYAKEDGFVYGGEAVALFGKSGMPQNQLAAIWNMVDSPVDNRLDRLEFAMAMHLIVCVTKKNLPMPGGLPPSLQQLKQQQQPQAAAAAPRSQTPVQAGSPGLAPQQAPPAQQNPDATAAAVLAQASSPPPLGAAEGGMSISDAFEGLSPEPPVPEPEPEPQPPAPVPVPEPAAAQPQVQASAAVAAVPPQPAAVETVTPPVPQAAAPAQPAAAPQVSVGVAAAVPAGGGDGESAELNQMKELLTKLQAENISLKAQLSGTTEEEREIQQELATTIAEVARLSSVLAGLRQEVSSQKTRLMDLQTTLKSAKENVGLLNGLIQEETATKEALEQANQAMAAGSNGSKVAAPVQNDLYGSGAPTSYGQTPAAGAPAAYGQPPAPTGYSEAPTPSYGEAPPPVAVEPAQESVEMSLSNAGANSSIREETSLELQAAEAAETPPVQPSSSLPSEAPAAPSFEYGAGGNQPGQLPGTQNMPQPQSSDPSHNRNLSTASAFGFNDGDYMGGAPLPNANQPPQPPVNYAANAAPTTSPEQFAEMRKKAKEADDVARDAEENHRTILAEVEELRKAAEAADASHSAQRRTSDASKSQKKKGMFGGGNKQQKKEAKLAEQMALDAKAKKDALLQAQGRANDAQAVAMETRREADKLRKAAEEAEVAQASANSRQQQPNGVAAQPPPQPQQYYQQKPQQQAPPPQTPPYQQQAVSADPNAGLSIPTPTDQPYANPFG